MGDDDVACVGSAESRIIALETASATLQAEFAGIDAVCLTGGNGRMLAGNAPCGRQTSAPQADEVVVMTQTLSITGVTAAEVCTDNGKRLIQVAVAKMLSISSSYVEISKCSDQSRRSRRLLAGGVDLEYKVTLPASEATASKQSAMLSSMAKLDNEDSGVISAIAQAAGKDVSAITVSGSSPTVAVVEQDDDSYGGGKLNAASSKVMQHSVALLLLFSIMNLF